MAEVPLTPTPIAMPEASRVGARAFARLFGRLVPRGMLAIQLAIIGIENRNGEAIICFNWGNLAGNGPAGYWVPPPLGEGQPTKFQACVDHDQGAGRWWDLMVRKYLPVLLAGDAGNTREAIHQLYSLGYVASRSEGEETAYAGTVAKLYAKARGEWIPKGHVYPTAPAYVGGASALGALAAKLGGF